jgi:dolichol-phosphate mannosyltransferase
MDSSHKISLPGGSTLDIIWVLIGLGILIRLVFIGLLNLLPEEAYYWNYARHLDIGYLDHPPMVAWLIYLSGLVFGRSEFSVRLPAFLGWFVFAYFMYRFTVITVGKSVGKPVLLLLAVLPIYLSVGFLMTPDAPFYVFWAGVLYFLSKVFFEGQSRAWYAVGVCLGLGLLSKFTMGLVVPAAFVYMLIDKEARQWFKKPYPYIALLLGFIIFTPDLFWNYQNHWASFAFQGTRRWSGGAEFSLHILLGTILVLITPLGLYEAIKVFVDFRKNRKKSRRQDVPRYRKELFLITFTLVPLLVFVVHSLQGQPKLNWTGPVWLALLPLIGARIYGMKLWRLESTAGRLTRRWVTTAAALAVLFSIGFGYMVAGMPGMVKDSGMVFPIAWKAYGNRIEELESRVEKDTRKEPLIIGLDKYWLASQASFYDPDGEYDLDTLPEVAGQNLFGGNGLMWNSWVTPEKADGRSGIIISFTEEKLKQKWVTDRFSRVGDINKETLTNFSGEIGHFYWRAGYGYRAVPSVALETYFNKPVVFIP